MTAKTRQECTLTDGEAMEIRDKFGYLLKVKSNGGNRRANLHIPEEEGSKEPLCTDRTTTHGDDPYVKKENEVLTHEYVKKSSYGYCSRCAEKWRNGE